MFYFPFKGHMTTVNAHAEEREGFGLNFGFSTHENSLIFKVKGCKGAQVRLQAAPTFRTHYLYDVIIDDKNNVTSISKTLNADVIASTTEVRLDCDRALFFWLRSFYQAGAD